MPMEDGTLAVDVLVFVRASLPEPPARVLEVGAGDGQLAAALRDLGHDVTAIDPKGEAAGVQPVALLDLEAPAGSYDAAVAIARDCPGQGTGKYAHTIEIRELGGYA